MIDNFKEKTSLVSDFVSKHDSIDDGIKIEKARSKLINKEFLVLDIVLMISIPAILLVLWYSDANLFVLNIYWMVLLVV